MELPFTVVFEAPSQEELRDVLRMRGTWVAGLIVALALGAAYLLANVSRADAGAVTSGVMAPVQQGSLDARLRHIQPRLTRLRPALPGARLTDVRLLDDGRLGLSIALPSGRQLQAWRLEPRSGVLEPVLTELWGSRLAFAPDGGSVAYVGSDVGPPRSGSDTDESGRVLWLVAPGRALPSAGWRAPLEPGERLLDASWSPRAERLLVFSGQTPSGEGGFSRLWLVDGDGQHARLALSLPSEVVPGSAAWSPDGRHVVFLAHAGEVNALCLLGTDGGFRYVADLEPTSAPPLPYPPAAWSVDGRRLLFVAPHQHPPGAVPGWLRADTQHALFVDDVDNPLPVPLADTSVDTAAWQPEGQVLGLGRSNPDAPLSLRLLSSSTSSQPSLELGLKPAGSYAVAWDVARARLLIAVQTAAGREYWLVNLGQEGDA